MRAMFPLVDAVVAEATFAIVADLAMPITSIRVLMAHVAEKTLLETVRWVWESRDRPEITVRTQNVW